MAALGLGGLVAVALALLLLAESRPARAAAEVYTYDIVQTFPHDHRAFTQGLEYNYACTTRGSGAPQCRDTLWESTGMYGQSTVRTVDLQTGRVLQSTAMARSDFGEGLVRDANGHLAQLLWRTGKTYKYDADTLERVATLGTGLRDGWGLATDGRQLYATDSSTLLYTLHTDTHAVTSSKEITWKGRPVKWVNELEWIDGEIWGNIWQTECIARINPDTAEVKSWVLMDGLTAKTRQRNQIPRMDVLNGIACDARRRRLFVTGKYWPRLYEVTVREVPPEEAEDRQQQVHRDCILR